jgi:CheY-like chemotaxis protein
VRVLLADDDPVNREVLSRLMSRIGVEVEIAPDGVAALDLYRNRGPFDLALLDLGMPAMDGFATVAAIRDFEADAGWPRLPALAMTGSEEDPAIAESGFDGMLQKPLGLARLEGAIARYARR